MTSLAGKLSAGKSGCAARCSEPRLSSAPGSCLSSECHSLCNGESLPRTNARYYSLIKEKEETYPFQGRLGSMFKALRTIIRLAGPQYSGSDYVVYYSAKEK